MRFDTFINEDKLTESIEDRGIFKAIMMAGQSGAGKSYSYSKIKSGAIEPRVVNVDTWIEHFRAEYDTPAHHKAKLLTKNQFYQYVNSLLPLLIDSTSTDPVGVLKRYSILESLGYDIGMIFINVSLETSMSRVELRNQQGKRIVPLHKAKEYYEKAVEVKGFLKGKFPFFIEINNDPGELTDDVVLKAFKKVSYFYDTSVKNPVGQKTIATMMENGWKYLTPDVYTESELKSIVSEYYRSN